MILARIPVRVGLCLGRAAGSSPGRQAAAGGQECSFQEDSFKRGPLDFVGRALPVLAGSHERHIGAKKQVPGATEIGS